MTVKYDEFESIWAPANTAVDDNGSEYNSIQNAVDNATDTILIGPGKFSESVTITTSDLNILGTGSGSFIDGGTNGPAVKIDASNVAIKDIDVSTSGGSGNTYHGIELTANADDATIKSVTVRDSDADGVNSTGSDDIHLSDVGVDAADGDGINTDSASARAIIEAVTVRSNVSGNGVTMDGDESQLNTGTINGVGSNGVDISGDDQIVGGLLIKNPSTNGVRLGGADQAVHDCHITGTGSQEIDRSSATRPFLRDNRPESLNNGFRSKDAQNAVGEQVGDGLSYAKTAGSISLDVIDSGSVTLSSGAATVDTGVDSSKTFTVLPALGPSTDDADIACEVRSASGGNYEIDFVETQDTSIGNPTVNYDIVAVRNTASEGGTGSMWIDPFDDTNLSEYTGDTGKFSFSTTAVQGSNSLSTSNSGSLATITSSSGLDNYPSKGDRWRVYFRCGNVTAGQGNIRSHMDFGRVDSNNHYNLQINWNDLDNVFLFKTESGNTTKLDSTLVDPDFKSDTWYRVEFTWDDGTLGGNDGDITVEFYDNSNGDKVGELFVNDTTHNGTDIQWGGRSEVAESVFIDGAELI